MGMTAPAPHQSHAGPFSFFKRAPVQSGGIRVALVISTDELSR